MNKKILFGLIILILVNAELNARSDFRDGFIIKAPNDTLFGKIDYRSNLNNSKSCLFKTASGIVEYSPDQIEGYGFINDKYFSSQIIKGIFVEVLVAGDLSLYMSGNDLFVRKTGSELYKLESKQIRDTAQVAVVGGTDNVVGYREDIRWKGTLSFLTSDCVESSQKIQRMTLNEKELTKFVISYNLCKGSPFTDFKSHKPWIHLGVGAYAGASLSILKFTEKDYLHDYLADTYNSWNPSYGLSVEFSSPRVNERIAIQADLFYIKADFYSYVEGHQGLATTYYETNIDISTLAVPVMVKYTFPAGKYSFFLSAGMEFDTNFDTSSSLYAEVVSGSTVNSYDGEAVNISKNQIGYVGGMGFARSLGKMNLGTVLRYYHSAEVRTDHGYDWNLSRLSLSLILSLR